MKGIIYSHDYPIIPPRMNGKKAFGNIRMKVFRMPVLSRRIFWNLIRGDAALTAYFSDMDSDTGRMPDTNKLSAEQIAGYVRMADRMYDWLSNMIAKWESN